MQSDKNRTQLAALPMSLWALLFVGMSLFYIIGLSLLSHGEGFTTQGPLSVDNYARLGDQVYIKSLLLSLRLAGLTTLICLVLGYPFAYFIARRAPRYAPGY